MIGQNRGGGGGGGGEGGIKENERIFYIQRLKCSYQQKMTQFFAKAIPALSAASVLWCDLKKKKKFFYFYVHFSDSK